MKPFSASTAASIALAGALFVSSLGSAEASLTRRQPAVKLPGDLGGVVISQGMKVTKAKDSDRFVRVAGACASTCTLYLSMPESRICITRNASFNFELPYGSSKRAKMEAASYLLQSYPAWVKSWIDENGGLSSDMKPMPYSYASQFLTTCSEA